MAVSFQCMTKFTTNKKKKEKKKTNKKKKNRTFYRLKSKIMKQRKFNCFKRMKFS